MTDPELIAAGGLLSCYAATGQSDHWCTALGEPLGERVRFELAWRYAVRTGKPLRTPDPCTHAVYRTLNGLDGAMYCANCAKDMS